MCWLNRTRRFRRGNGRDGGGGLAWTGDPGEMLLFLEGKTTERKLRLFAVACCHRISPLLVDESSLRAVQVCDEMADGDVAEDERVGVYLLNSELARRFLDKQEWVFARAAAAAYGCIASTVRAGATCDEAILCAAAALDAERMDREQGGQGVLV